MKKIDKKIVGYEVVSHDQKEIESEAEALSSADEGGDIPDIDPTREPMESSPSGFLDALRWKGHYHTSSGRQSLFLQASFMKAKAIHGGEEFEVERLVELFMPAGQREEIQPWSTLVMRLASMCLRMGIPAWQVLGEFTSVPGSENILFDLPNGKKRAFTSEPAVIGQAFLNMLHHRGLVDDEGYDIPYHERPRDGAERAPQSADQADDGEEQAFPESATVCKKCRIKAVVVMDGCATCLNCGDSKCG